MKHIIAFMRSLGAKRGLLLPAALLALSGCSVLPESETLVFYRLPGAETFKQTPGAQLHRLPLALRIATPYANRAVDSTRILVVPEADQVSAYKGVRWSDVAPVLLRDRLLEVFRASGAFSSAVTDSGSLAADLELASDLFQYHVVYRSGTPVVQVVLDATLSEPASSRILASRRFAVDEPVRGKEVPEVVQAFGVAVDSLAAQLLAWSREQAAEGNRP